MIKSTQHHRLFKATAPPPGAEVHHLHHVVAYSTPNKYSITAPPPGTPKGTGIRYTHQAQHPSADNVYCLVSDVLSSE